MEGKMQHMHLLQHISISATKSTSVHQEEEAKRKKKKKKQSKQGKQILCQSFVGLFVSLLVILVAAIDLLISTRRGCSHCCCCCCLCLCLFLLCFLSFFIFLGLPYLHTSLVTHPKNTALTLKNEQTTTLFSLERRHTHTHTHTHMLTRYVYIYSHPSLPISCP